eukprot:12401008-Karenia_brevis.AAC.1
MALSMVSEQEITVNAAAMTRPLTVQQYKSQIAQSMWGDNLMIIGLTRCFKKDISVIRHNSARTFLAAGGERDGVLPSSVWVAHRAELHYYGVIRSGAAPLADADGLGRTGSCPLCTEQFTCGVCKYTQAKAQQKEKEDTANEMAA